MRLSTLDLEFWAAGFLLNLTLLLILWWRDRARTFPSFTALIALQVIKTIVLYEVLHHGTARAYHDAYWSLTIIDTVVQLLVVYEVARLVFRPLNVWAADLRRSFVWLASLSVAVALGLTFLASPPVHNWMESFTTKGNLFTAALMSELFVALMGLSVAGGYPWKTHVATIAQGIGVYSLISVVIETGHAYLGPTANIPAFSAFTQVRMLAYLGSVFYWIAMLSRDEVPSKTMSAQMRQRVLQLQSQIEYDLRFLRSWKS